MALERTIGQEESGPCNINIGTVLFTAAPLRTCRIILGPSR